MKTPAICGAVGAAGACIFFGISLGPIALGAVAGGAVGWYLANR